MRLVQRLLEPRLPPFARVDVLDPEEAAQESYRLMFSAIEKDVEQDEM